MGAQRRNRLIGRQPLLSWGIGAVSGVLAAWAGAAPTGARGVDVALVALFAAAVTTAAATAPWWALAGAAAIAAMSTTRPLLVGVALCAVAVAIVIGARRLNMPWARSLVALAAVQVFVRLDGRGFFGLTAIIGCTTLAVLFVLGVRRRPRVQRRRVWMCVGVVGVAAAVAGLGLALSAMNARAPLQEANRQANAGLSALNNGDMPAAAADFAAAARAFSDADDRLSSIWAQPSRLLPVAAQHRSSTAGLSSTAAVAMNAAALAVGQIDPSSLRIADGRIDIAAVRALVAPFHALQAAIGEVGVALDQARSPWLVAALQHKLTDLHRQVDRNKVRVDNAALAVQVAPDMLGGSGLRRYFIAFTTPAEARGLGGFMGNWAEITIDDGLITMTRFGRTSDLNQGTANPGGRTITGLPEFIHRWGRFGFFDAQGTTSIDVWSNLTMAPDFPTLGQVIAQLYPQSGGLPLDGAFSLDPQAIAALMTFTGPITVDGVAQPLTAQTAAQFIIKDQYELGDTATRIDLLDQIAHATVARLLTSTLPPPADLARTFSPLARQGRITAWSPRPAEEDLLNRVGMAGAFPQLHGGDGVAVVVDNEGANKIDQFLGVKVDYAAVHLTGADYTGTLTVTLTNNAPSAGLPEYVIGNPLKLPTGTNRMFLSLYTAMPMTSVTLDGQATTMETDTAFGWNVAARLVDIAPGTSRVFVLELGGRLDAVPYTFVTRIQPLAIPAATTAVAPDGRTSHPG